MVPCMKETGKMVMLQGKGSSIIPMVIFMKVNGITIKPMAMEFTLTKRERDTKATGKMINSMGRV